MSVIDLVMTSLPILVFIAISQSETTLTKISFRAFNIR